MKYIRVKLSGSPKVVAKIILNEGRITIEATKDIMRISLKEMIDKWKCERDMKDAEIFNVIPFISSNLSRLYFSNIISK